MIKIFFISLGVFLIFVLGMAIGVIFGKKPIKGSCGGLGKIMGKSCPHCNNKKCIKRTNK